MIFDDVDCVHRLFKLLEWNLSGPANVHHAEQSSVG